MMKSVSVYFSIITKPKVTIFDDESITIWFLSPWPLLWSHIQYYRYANNKINFFSNQNINIYEGKSL